MITRPSRDELNLGIAELISQRATCLRGSVGCVITQNFRIVSTGYNGPVMNGKHCKDLECDISKKCQHSLHAEANAIAAAAREGISLKGSTLYCTVEPCEECAKLIIQAGIKEVIFTNLYTTSTNAGTPLLKINKVKVIWKDESTKNN